MVGAVDSNLRKPQSDKGSMSHADYTKLLHGFAEYSILIGQSRRSTVCYFFIADRCYV